ncbi:hypothetical protein EG68_07339 [Paragonimus skrjabini miyazakii]|uniref:Uncharacterized protein n=1 Tax=Paragonimus skrjabini miyazakii TaxID=59628 RepID=A0A8S9YUC1_9TREM|nr:hypothetical protein EG68_07339 [Paragonimus skrjabini miyazakii]
MMHQDFLKKASPLHYCCMTGDIQSLAELIQQNEGDVCTMDDLHYWTPAHWAASFNRLDCLRILKMRGAVNTPSFRSMVLPLHLACEQGHTECVQLLLSSDCKINTQDYQGDTPLHKAARGGHINCVNLLVHAGARVKIQSAHVTCDVSSRAPLFIPDRPSNCCKRQNLNAFDELLDKRRKFSDPVLQLATDMLGTVGTDDPCALQSSVLEHAACMNMADTYANHYFSYLESDKTRCQ